MPAIGLHDCMPPFSTVKVSRGGMAVLLKMTDDRWLMVVGVTQLVDISTEVQASIPINWEG